MFSQALLLAWVAILFSSSSMPLAQGEQSPVMNSTEKSQIIAAALVQESRKFNAPFSEKSLRRLHAPFFMKKSTRFTNVVIYNTSNKPFKLKDNACDTGRFRAPMLPEFEIEQYHSIVYGVESKGFMTGVTNCHVEYTTPDDSSFFKVYTSNPYIGWNHAGVVESSGGITVQTINTGGRGNIVQFRIL